MLVDLLHHLAAAAITDVTPFVLAQPEGPLPPGGPDFSNIRPDPRGVPKAGVMFTIAQVILFVGLGISFIVLLGGIIVWVAGHMAGGMHLSQNAKTNMLRAAFGGILLTAAGGIWTWITAIN